VRRVLIALLVLALAAPVVTFAVAAFFFAQRADYGWTPHVARPAFTGTPPRVRFDEAHGNATIGRFWGRGWPLARLLQADGCEVLPGDVTFTLPRLREVDLLVIMNASGSHRAQAFGINLNPNGGSDRARPAFTPAEIEAVSAWVEGGGALLLVADHAPFGESARALAARLGVTMHGGFVEVPGEKSDPLEFSRANHRLAYHPITAGVNRVQTFTGQSLDGPLGASLLLRLPANAVESVPDSNDHFTEQPAGPAQGLAFEYGGGRVVVMGEAAALTAQVAERKRFGMNLSGNDNQQFALGIVHWLMRRT
jgi:hypothetical protein